MISVVCILITARPGKPGFKEYRVGITTEDPVEFYQEPQEPEDSMEMNEDEALSVFDGCDPFYDVKYAEGYAMRWRDEQRANGCVEQIEWIDFHKSVFPRRQPKSVPKKKSTKAPSPYSVA